MSKHTSEPWRVVEINTAKTNIMAGQQTLATVYRHLGSPVLRDRAGEGDANAALMRAAPNLLDALRDIADAIEHPIHEQRQRARLKARAAIAEAEGGAA